MDRVAAFGVGSTNFRYVAATPDGQFHTDVTVERTRPRELAEQVVDGVESLAGECGGIDAVAVATAGLVDADAGVVESFDAPDGETVETVDLGGPLADRGLPFAVENDASAAALGEWYNAAGVGAVCNAVDPALVTLGGRRRHRSSRLGCGRHRAPPRGVLFRRPTPDPDDSAGRPRGALRCARSLSGPSSGR